MAELQDPDGHFIGWAPGRGPIVVPEGMPWRLDRGADLVVELHMLPPKSPHVVQPSIALFLASSPPVQTPLTVKMGSKLIDIPAGEPAHVVTDTYELPVAVDLMSVYPHAHYLGKDMLVTAAFPDGTKKTLLHIPQWSFHWQQDYRYATPIPLPAGTTIDDALHLRQLRARTTTTRTCRRCESGSARTRPTRWRSSDCRCCRSRWPTPRASCSRSPSATRSPTWRSARCACKESPDHAEYQAFLGASYVEVGRFADAIPHLEAAIRLDERSAGAHNDLGTALMSQGRLPEALAPPAARRGRWRRATSRCSSTWATR